jgi:tetratricopeptide (TPR) repeat protein
MIKKATKFIQQGKFGEAEKILRVLIDKSPMNTEALFNLALARREQDDIWEAMELMRQAIGTQPSNASLHFALGNMLLSIEDYDEAEKNFLKAAGLDPNSVDARNGIAFVELRQYRFQAAEHSLRIALNIEPDNVQSLVFIGIALLEQGQHDNAIEYLQKAIQLQPENIQAQLCIGRSLLAAGNAGFATRCFENAVKAEPQTAEFRDWLACAQLNTGNFEEARDNFKKAIELGRVNVEILTGLVKTETQLGNSADALGVMAQAVQFAPDQQDLALQYSEMLLDARMFDEAISQLQGLHASGYKPEHVAIRLATALMNKGDTEQALRILEPLCADTDVSAEIRMMLTWVLQQSGDDKAASEHLDILLAMERPLIDAVLFRARQMFDAEDDQGVELLQQLLKREDINGQQARQAQQLLAHSQHQCGAYEQAAMEYRGLANRDAAVMQLVNRGVQSGSEGETAVSAMEPAVSADWPTQPPEDNRGQPVFIFAWPGSGRSRLLTALNVHSGLTLLSGQASEQLHRRDRLTNKQGANALGSLDESNIRMGRRQYWKAAGSRREFEHAGQVLDSQWLGAEMLPGIARYFPGTTIIVLAREPCDMVVSWMQTGFRDIESMASAYRGELDMLNKCRQSLPLNFVEVDYDQLCEHPEEILSSALNSLHLEPEQELVKCFNDAIVSVPAHNGDWQHYRDELSGIFANFD